MKHSHKNVPKELLIKYCNTEEVFETLDICKNEIHIWVADMNRLRGKVEYFFNLLSFNEKEKAQKFNLVGDKERYIIAHGFLRILLSKYLKISAYDLVLTKGRHGKIELDKNQNSKKISFNHSHSENRVVLSFTKFKEIGVDVEKIREIPNCVELAQNFFCRNESLKVEQSKDDKKLDVFFKLWTIKEAFVKATGEGLSQSLDSFCVSSKNSFKIFELNNWLEKSEWEYLLPNIDKNYACAVVIKNR